MIKRIFIVVAIALLVLMAAGCQSTDQTNTQSANTNTAATTTPGPDNSEITSRNESGVRTETRTFRSNPRVSRVVVTTRDGHRTAKVYSTSGEERELTNGVENALNATGDAIADSVGFAKTAGAEVGDKAEDVADKTKDVAKTVGEKTVEGADKVKDKTVDVSKTVGEKSKDVGKTVVKGTKEGVRKTGKAIKKVIP